MPQHILILGGTSEARELAEQLAAGRGRQVMLSLAGRTAAPLPPQATPYRVGGFGGAAGLAEYLRRHRIDALIDATHPYAAVISANAVTAAREAGTRLLALRRPPWRPVRGDRWTEVDDVEHALRELGAAPRRVFSALGRKEVSVLARAPQHFYLLRSVDPIALDLPRVEYVVERGPFREAEECALMQKHAIDVLVSRNSGGHAAVAKLGAARALAIPVLLLRRPTLPDAPSVATVREALAWLDHDVSGSAERGV